MNEKLFKHTGNMVDSNLKYDLSGCKLLVFLFLYTAFKYTNALFYLWDALMPTDL